MSAPIRWRTIGRGAFALVAVLPAFTPARAQQPTALQVLEGAGARYRGSNAVCASFVQERSTQVRCYGDLIRRHREEHAQAWLTAALQEALADGAIEPVLQRFLRQPA